MFGTGGTLSGSGGTSPVGTGGMPAVAGAGGTLAGGGGMPAAGTGGSSTPPPAGDWPAADPAQKGPYATVTENNVGPDMAFTLFRPMDLTQDPQLHPVITWGNGTGTTPNVYAFLLDQLASHGFIVIASNSMNVAQGTPPPMLQGVDWVFQQNDDMTSPLYHHVDTSRVGATGHSQGAFATTTAGSDMRITTIAPIEGTLPNGQLHGPALLLCGGMDTTVGCDGTMSAFTADTVPVMYAELLAASHTNWFTGGFGGAPMHPFVVAVTAWMRVQLMNDTALRPWFYGPDCSLCKDTAWNIMQKMLD
jgi:dienelactone hydrolase